MEVRILTVGSGVRDKIYEYLEEKYGSRNDVFFYPIYDVDIFMVTTDPASAVDIYREVKVICQYEHQDGTFKIELVKDEG